MKKSVLIILPFVLIVIILAYFYFFSPDTIFPLFQEEPDFYIHLNLKSFSYSGRKGMKWIKNYKPSSKITEPPLINFNPTYFSLMDEAALAFFKTQINAENNPSKSAIVVVYKLKPQFQKFDWSFIGKSHRLNKKFIVLAKNEELFKKLELAKASFPKHFSVQFFSGFFKSLNLEINFFGQPQENYLIFQGNLPKNLPLFIKKENKILSGMEKFITTDPQVAFWNFYPVGISEGKFVFPKDFFNNQNFFLLENENYFLVMPPKENLEDSLLKYLSEKFPPEIERTLQDGSKIFELVSDPSLFKWQIKESLDWELKFLKEKDFNFGLVKKENLIILSNNPDWLEEKINLFENPAPSALKKFFNLKSLCLKNSQSEIFYWQNSSFRIIGGAKGDEKIEGCLGAVEN